MSTPKSHFVEGPPRIHYLEWNSRGPITLVLLHGNAANAWWWEPLAAQFDPHFRLLALDQRGHGDSEWIRPPAYGPDNYAHDAMMFIERLGLRTPILVGHSMGGINVLAFAAKWPSMIRAAVSIDVAITSSRGRDRYVRRLKALPTIDYPDLEMARARYRLMPKEGHVPHHTLMQIADHSFQPAERGGFTLKFDRESFYGSDGLDVRAVAAGISIPLLLVRGEKSKIMTAEAAHSAAESNPRVRLVEIPGVHHHLLLERPDLLASVLTRFVTDLGA